MDNLKYKMVFLFLAYIGLRVGEAVKIKLSDVDLDRRYVKIQTEKQRRVIYDTQPIPEIIIPSLRLYIKKYETRMKLRGGWFFPQRVHNEKHIEPHTVRKKYYEYRDACGLDQSYAIANDVNNPMQVKTGERKLHNRTLHSFRHWYKVKLDKACIPYGMIQSLMRHTGRSVTDQYGQYSFEEKLEVIDEVFI
ncbi:site-specific integrase [archaeon]|nr:site-specific integrase [archaeon]MBT4397630.1 site-specific integrase [archaeon]MBT4441675.1 site-specific integrase [archaeon]